MSLDIKYKKEEFYKENTHKFMQVEFKRVTVQVKNTYHLFALHDCKCLKAKR